MPKILVTISRDTDAKLRAYMALNYLSSKNRAASQIIEDKMFEMNIRCD